MGTNEDIHMPRDLSLHYGGKQGHSMLGGALVHGVGVEKFCFIGLNFCRRTGASQP